MSNSGINLNSLCSHEVVTGRNPGYQMPIPKNVSLARTQPDIFATGILQCEGKSVGESWWLTSRLITDEFFQFTFKEAEEAAEAKAEQG